MKVDNIRLNSHQKTVLAIIAVSSTAGLAASDIAKNVNLVTAAQLLAKLGVIVFDANTAALTEQGTQVATEENIIDQTGALSTNGQVYLKMSQRSAQPTGEPIPETFMSKLLKSQLL